MTPEEEIKIACTVSSYVITWMTTSIPLATKIKDYKHYAVLHCDVWSGSHPPPTDKAGRTLRLVVTHSAQKVHVMTRGKRYRCDSKIEWHVVN
jgi:hypothetical protein